MTISLLLVRHGRPDFESKDFVTTTRGRQWDPPLHEKGREQARALAARLQLLEPRPRIVTSPFSRCRQTIQPYQEVTGAPVDVAEDLGEVFIGDWEGLSFEQIVSGDEELARRFRDQEAMFSMAPGGESGAQLRARVVPEVERILARAAEDGVASAVVVAHGGVINAYLGHVLGIAHDMFFLPDHASINTVRVDGDDREVRFLNDVRHVTDPALFVPPTPA